MNKRVLLTALLAVATMFGVSAQKFKPAPSFLKGQSEINIVFDFSKVIYGNDSQVKYYKGKDSEWITNWEGEKRSFMKDSFIKDVNAELKKLNIKFGSFAEAKYTLIVEIMNCDFGAYAGPFSVPAKIQATVRIVKTNTTETLSTVTLKANQNSNTVISTPIDFDRMFMAFGELGEDIGEILVKVLK